jgi:DNA-binding CsgD family transcriptional regulator/enamine deaminase RidA (YjgF/YER057c/UK114 family)
MNEAELAGLGGGDTPAFDALTGREREVAALVATGITNREIAARLVLSEKTVERHLSRIFAKLGLSSRAALAACAEQARLRDLPTCGSDGPRTDSPPMQRTAINPHSWTTALGFDQAELIEGHQRLLVCSGQDAVDADGTPQHPGDMAAQVELALDHLEAIVAAAEMTLANIVRLNIYTTDVDELIGQHFPRITERFGSSRYATSIVGVAHLPAQFLVMLEATAVD